MVFLIPYPAQPPSLLMLSFPAIQAYYRHLSHLPLFSLPILSPSSFRKPICLHFAVPDTISSETAFEPDAYYLCVTKLKAAPEETGHDPIGPPVCL